MKKPFLPSVDNSVPLSGAWEVNGLVFVSGQVHVDASGNIAGKTIEEQLELTITNVKKRLAAADLTLDDVVRVQLYLTDLSQLPALNKAYKTYFKHPLPVRTAIGVVALPLGANLEMDVIAARA
jgi:2-iminobutanoate/2-iminopropanoate deaminase